MCSNILDFCKDIILVLIFKLYEFCFFVVLLKRVKICKWKIILNCVIWIYYISSNYVEILSYFIKNYYIFEELKILWKWGVLFFEDDGIESLLGVILYIYLIMIIYLFVCREWVIIMK